MANSIAHDVPGEVAAPAPTLKGSNTCGYVQFPVTSLRFPMKARPWTCPKPEETCTSSGSYAGCKSPVPTKCFGSSLESNIIAYECADDQLCCRWRPNTACYTWLSTGGASTFTLYECRSTQGVGTILATPTGSTASPAATGTQTRGSRTPSPPGLITSPTAAQDHDGFEDKTPPGAVAASIAGALAFLGLLAGAVVYLWVWNKKKMKRQGTLHRRGSMAISGPYLISGAPPKVPPPPRGYEMQTFDEQRNTSSVYSTEGADGRASKGIWPVENVATPRSQAPRRPRRSGDFGGAVWI